MTKELLNAILHLKALAELPIEKQKSYVREYPELGWDGIVVMKAYLAELHDDDWDAVTEEWLRRVGFVKTGKLSLALNQKNDACTFSLHCADYANIPCPWELWNFFDDHSPAEGSCLPNQPETRGDVRRLCRALGIELKHERMEAGQ